ncbi:ACT domain-containing protein ACR9-like [Iris pallida]|uniref:ACT domain-containing protein ACR n=2 Tax=Iris pallida TaxID=29817 RepID=A0AAX6HQ75_IRIPA|nr:ACT domain-containing protein ACR9-like [Iris pallida]KAJ6842968.1 ACT domain-containing protein ACR9-like [Iris pallida]
MGVRSDEMVEIQVGKGEGEASVITVNCPDKTGLGCDLCHTILEFGLRIQRGDVSTDGKWCFVVFWVIPRTPKINIQWLSLKNRLLSLCPSCPIPFYFDIGTRPTTSPVYLLKLFSVDRKGLLHDVTHVLCELELLIHRVKVSTTPDGRVMDLFFISDGMELLHTKKRQDDTCERLNAVLGESCISCELQLIESFQQGFSSLPPDIADELFRPEISEGDAGSQAISSDMSKLKKVNVVMDNSLSPSQTLLQIHCVDQKGLLYDIMRTLKDCNIQIAYGRFLSDKKGHREVDLFIQQADGKKIVDPEKQESICSRLKLEMLHPLRVIIVNRGPDTELLVANPVELSGKGRPLVFYDVTLALKLLGICIFSAEIGRQTASERQWEVYRFRLDDSREFPLSNRRARSQIVDRVRRTLMGW